MRREQVLDAWAAFKIRYGMLAGGQLRIATSTAAGAVPADLIDEAVAEALIANLVGVLEAAIAHVIPDEAADECVDLKQRLRWLHRHGMLQDIGEVSDLRKYFEREVLKEDSTRNLYHHVYHDAPAMAALHSGFHAVETQLVAWGLATPAGGLGLTVERLWLWGGNDDWLGGIGTRVVVIEQSGASFTNVSGPADRDTLKDHATRLSRATELLRFDQQHHPSGQYRQILEEALRTGRLEESLEDLRPTLGTTTKRADLIDRWIAESSGPEREEWVEFKRRYDLYRTSLAALLDEFPIPEPVQTDPNVALPG